MCAYDGDWVTLAMKKTTASSRSSLTLQEHKGGEIRTYLVSHRIMHLMDDNLTGPL